MNIILVTALFTGGIGVTVLVQNSRRAANQALALLCATTTVWLSLAYRQAHTADFTPWVRANAALSTFFPWIIWLIKEAILAPQGKPQKILRNSLPWLICCGALVPLCYSSQLIIPNVSAETATRGPAYFAHSSALIIMFALLVFQGARQARFQTGICQLELEFVAVNVGIGGIICGTLIAWGNYTHTLAAKRWGLVFLCASLALTAWTITFKRIFDVRQVFYLLAQRTGVLAVAAVGITLTMAASGAELSVRNELVICLVMWCLLAVWLDRKTREWLGLDGQRSLATMRKQIIDAARSETNIGILTSRFETLLCQYTQSTSTSLLFEQERQFWSPKLVLSKFRLGYTALLQWGWATPETINRHRSDSGLADLGTFLAQERLAAIIAAPRGHSNPAMVLAIDARLDERPFTYPEIERLHNLAELIDNILAHSRLANQAALQAKMEHLAMLSRGLAHDLKNLISPVSSFLVHTDGRYEAGSPEAEVHAAARQSVRIMTDYVREALFFSERLAPKFEPVDLGATFEAVRSLTAERAQTRSVGVVVHSSFSQSMVADAVLIQRLVANLVGNAIDASSPGQTVTISAASLNAVTVQIEVADNGRGIDPENLNRIFEPYFTTKDLGDNARGFGLGLTICQKIVNLHGGEIRVQSTLGQGTRFTAILPIEQPPPGLLPAQPCLALP